MRALIDRLEREVQRMPQVDCPVRHYFAPGLYAREISIPRGTVLTGAVHKRENIAVLSKGSLMLSTDNGPKRIDSPHTLTVRPGAKNVAVALEDAVWTNFFATDETDPEKLVELLTESTAQELIGGKSNVQLLQAGPQKLEE